jgi:hypothetical protein
LFGHCLSSSLVVLADQVGIFRRMNVASLTTLRVVTTTIWLRNTPFTLYQLLLPNIYIPFSLMNSTTSCPLSAITTFINSKLIKLATSREWMWSYKPPNRARLNPNRRCAPLIPTLGGLQWRWHRSFSDEALKVVTQSLMAMIPILQNHYICFMCSHFKPSQWDLIKNCIYSSQDQKARNKLLGLEVDQNLQNQVCCSITIVKPI